MDERFMENAAATELLHRNAAIAQVMAQRPDADQSKFDGVHCVEDDCGDAIPEGRLALGKIRCTTCQSIREKRRAP